ncbi:hypothetical protein SASPL_122082 [Salvia splendens]|uniref:Uncharacterized protein n=1 Tax=Salvia splendens TaxID=180675 RepID=A0A8X8XKN4_SALSN|nr:hypothetical protein SASPL_122082 [Salvia splendens]
MSMELTAEPVCYVNCNYCNTILAVNVPFGSMFTIVTLQKQQSFASSAAAALDDVATRDNGSSSKYNRSDTSLDIEQPKMAPIRPPEKRQRVPEEIQRVKASNPEISHREAFSTAAKNWAHFPHIHFGLKMESNKQAKMDHPVAAGEATAQQSLGV